MWVRKQVRELNQRFEERLKFIQKEYDEALEELQDQCDHESTTHWQYKLDIYNEIASNNFGVLYRYKECLVCGKTECQLDDINDYDAEIKF